MASADGSNVIKSLKIQVDNDMINQPKEYFESESMNDDIEEGEASSDDEDEVEVNVIVGSNKRDEAIYQGDNQYSQKTRDSKLITRSREASFYKPPAIRDRFVDLGQDHKSKNDLGKRQHRFKSIGQENEDLEGNSEEFIPSEIVLEERAKRFGMHPQSKTTIPKKQIQDLYKSLEISEDDFHRGGWRPEAIHVRGIENLQSSEIFNYFKDYSPHSIEWLNKVSCNVVWTNKEQPIEALIGLSCPIMLPPKMKNNTRQKNKKNIKIKEAKNMKARKEIKIEGNGKKDVNSSTTSKKSTSGGLSSSSSDSSSSSSESDDEDGSSSDSSSSSGSGSSDSSSSSSSSSNSSESSSDTSSDSENEQKSSKKKERVPPVQTEGKENETNNNHNNNTNNEDSPSHMDVDESAATQISEEKEGSVAAEDVGIPLPSGCWRLGVPCPKTKAILLRFAHCKDKKVPGLNRPIELNQNFMSKRIKEEFIREGEAGRFFKRPGKLPRLYTDETWDVPVLRPSKRHQEERFEKPSLELGKGKGYKDLDDPADDNKNPWGFLAHNWGRKETQDNLDYQELLRQHVTGQKRKHNSSGSEEEDYAGESVAPRRHARRASFSPRRSRHQHARVFRYHNRWSDEYDDEDDAYEDVGQSADAPEDDDDDDVVAWNSRIRLPLMRMYADAEEKKQERRQKEARSIGSRLGGGRKSSWREKRPRPVPSSGDLRSKLLQRKKNVLA